MPEYGFVVKDERKRKVQITVDLNPETGTLDDEEEVIGAFECLVSLISPRRIANGRIMDLLEGAIQSMKGG